MVDTQRGYSAVWLALGLTLLGPSSCGGTSERRNGGSSRGGESGSGAQGGRAGSESSGGAGPSGGSNTTGGSSTTGGSNATGGDSGGGGTSAMGGSSGSAGSGPSGGGGGGLGGTGGEAGSGGDGGGASVSYSACQFGSGIARYVIGRLDMQEDDCTVLMLSVPGSDTFGITLPTNWGVENAFRFSPASGDCPLPTTGALPNGAVRATSGSGVVTTTGGTFLDVDVTLTFPPSEAGTPPMVHLEAGHLDASMSCVF